MNPHQYPFVVINNHESQKKKLESLSYVNVEEIHHRWRFHYTDQKKPENDHFTIINFYSFSVTKTDSPKPGEETISDHFYNHVFFSLDEIESIKSLLRDGYVTNTDEKEILEFISQQKIEPYQLGCKRMQKQTLMIPGTQELAARIITIFYNGTKDPLDVVSMYSNYLGDGQNETSLLFSYYVSCLIHSLNVNPLLFIKDLKNLLVVYTQADLVSDVYRSVMDTVDLKKEIDYSIVLFHALFFCYSICRNVHQDKSKFDSWVKRRFNALCAACTYPSTDTALDLKRGGAEMMRLSNERRDIRRLVLASINLKGLKEGTNSAIPRLLREQIMMLTQYASMSTLNFIHQLLNKGQIFIPLAPIADQLKTYVVEREEALNVLRTHGYDDPSSMLPYYKLVEPDSQSFASSKYPDIIIAVTALDRARQGRKSTMGQFNFNQNNAQLEVNSLVNFLKSSNYTPGVGKIIDSSVYAKLGEDLRITNLKELVREAQQAAYTLTRRTRYAYDQDSGNSTEDDDQSQE